MGSKGNTWCKKLIDKEKRRVMKLKLGNEEGILARAKGEHYHNAQILNERRAQLAKYKNNAVVDGDMPDKRVVEVKKIRKFNGPMVEGFRPRPFGKRQKDRVGFLKVA